MKEKINKKKLSSLFILIGGILIIFISYFFLKDLRIIFFELLILSVIYISISSFDSSNRINEDEIIKIKEGFSIVFEKIDELSVIEIYQFMSNYLPKKKKSEYEKIFENNEDLMKKIAISYLSFEDRNISKIINLIYQFKLNNSDIIKSKIYALIDEIGKNNLKEEDQNFSCSYLSIVILLILFIFIFVYQSLM